MRLDMTYHFPTLDDRDVLLDYIKEHIENGETHISASLGLANMDYNDWLEKITKMTTLSADDKWGRSVLFMACFNDCLVGLVNIRFEMDDDLQMIYGNVGYGVRPSARNMGFATEMLRFAMKECRTRGLNKIILGCVKNNIYSEKTILRCGGQLIKETSDGPYKPGIEKRYYQIRLTEESTESELWDLYDKDRNIVATNHVRGTWPIPDGMYHLVVHVWLKNSEGKFLLAQRSAKRKSNPLMWECHGGSVTKGEDSISAAIREVYEEVGIKVDPKDGKKVFSRLRDVIDGKKFGDIMDVWLFNYDGYADLEAATTDEVAQAQWMTVDEIRQLYQANKLVYTLDYFFDQIATQ